MPEIRRAEIAKAAQIMIRDELKLRRDKAKAAALSAKQARKPATRVARTPKPVAAVKAPAVKTPTVKTPAVAKPVTAAKKTPRTPRRQPASEAHRLNPDCFVSGVLGAGHRGTAD